jgi:hypothetical protein
VEQAIERLANSMRRAPYVWLAATILWFLLMNSGLARIAAEPGQGSTTLAVLGVIFGALGVIAWVLVGTPFFRRDGSEAVLVVTRWIFAMTPFLFAFCTVGAGGEQWAFFFGFLASVVLLVISARRTKRENVGSATP